MIPSKSATLADLPAGSSLDSYLIRFAETIGGAIWEGWCYAETPEDAIAYAGRVADREGSIVLSVAWTW